MSKETTRSASVGSHSGQHLQKFISMQHKRRHELNIWYF